MAITTEPLQIELIRRAVQNNLKAFVEEEFDKSIKEATDRAMKRKGEVVAGIMIEMMSMVQFEVMRNQIVITIKQAKE